MAVRRIGTIINWQALSPILSIFRLNPEPSTKFPDYLPGQYIALRRDDCKLRSKVAGPDGKVRYVPDLDENGVQKVGPVTHSYSIASAPYETHQIGYLEFYIGLETDETGGTGRLTESLFRVHLENDNTVTYFDRITGDFTLEKKAKSFENVLLVGTGTGLAPFVSMVKQLHHRAKEGEKDHRQYTLIHANRTYHELGYHLDLCEIESSKTFDFVYVPLVSRPSNSRHPPKSVGTGRANNLLRRLLDMPLKEEEDLTHAIVAGSHVEKAKVTLSKTVRPSLPAHLSDEKLKARLSPLKTVVLTCGNLQAMNEIKKVVESRQIQFEKEEW
jgi:ferredoxin-NADP reductase